LQSTPWKSDRTGEAAECQASNPFELVSSQEKAVLGQVFGTGSVRDRERYSPVSTASEMMHHHVWPQIEAMMLNDAHFRLVLKARRLTKKFNGPTTKLLQDGYLTLQMVTIRRLCDQDPDVYSLWGALKQSAKENPTLKPQIDQLLDTLKGCDHVCKQVNKHVAHTVDPARSQAFVVWDMGMKHLEDAQRAICKAAFTLERDILQICNRVEIIPVYQGDVLKDLRRTGRNHVPVHGFGENHQISVLTQHPPNHFNTLELIHKL
jgi:hypothetical protein